MVQHQWPELIMPLRNDWHGAGVSRRGVTTFSAKCRTLSSDFSSFSSPSPSSTMLLLPKPPTTAKLFLTGASVGSLVDSIHNQVLLQYDILPVSIPQTPAASFVSSDAAIAAAAADPIVCTSWLYHLYWAWRTWFWVEYCPE